MNIKIGMFCTFDPKNYMKQNDSQPLHVIVLERVKWKPFGHSIWLVRNVDNGKDFKSEEWLLEPASICGIRFPSDIPSFNDMDIDALEFAIVSLTTMMETPDVKNSFTKIEFENITKSINRLKAVKEKIKFCKEMRDV